jgi:type III restriction enzyme
LPMYVDEEASPGAHLLLRDDGQPIRKSLLQPVFESEFNGLEAEFACYLDSQAALRWWHRNVARSLYGLQGWRRDKVYPDFVFARIERDGADTLVVMETKGLHLKGNDDTEYKRRLMQRLSAMFEDERLARCGELELVDRDGIRLVCDLVMEPGWQGQMAARYFGGDGGTGQPR